MRNPLKVFKDVRKLNAYMKKAMSTPEQVSQEEIENISELASKYGVKPEQVKEMIINMGKLKPDDIEVIDGKIVPKKSDIIVK